jgi:carbon storage regulator
MLVLTRKSDESIIIGNDIVVKVIKTHGNQVQIGIDAPPDVTIYRQEIYEQVMDENKRAVRKSRMKRDISLLEKKLSSLQSMMKKQEEPDKE